MLQLSGGGPARGERNKKASSKSDSLPPSLSLFPVPFSLPPPSLSIFLPSPLSLSLSSGYANVLVQWLPKGEEGKEGRESETKRRRRFLRCAHGKVQLSASLSSVALEQTCFRGLGCRLRHVFAVHLSQWWTLLIKVAWGVGRSPTSSMLDHAEFPNCTLVNSKESMVCIHATSLHNWSS